MDSDQCFPVVDYHLSEQPKLNFIIYSRESKICLPLKQDATQSFLRDLIMERKN